MTEQPTGPVDLRLGRALLSTAAARMRTDVALMRAEMKRGYYWDDEATDDSYQRGVRDGLGGPSGDLAASFPPGVLEDLAAWLERAVQCWGVVEYADAASYQFAQRYLAGHPTAGKS